MYGRIQIITLRLQLVSGCGNDRIASDSFAVTSALGKTRRETFPVLRNKTFLAFAA